MRQDDAAADDRRAGGDQRGHDLDRRPRRQRPHAQGSRHRDGVPELRALSAHDGGQEHGLRAAARQGPGRGDPPQGGARRRPAGHLRPARAQARQSLRRPAPAGGDGPGHRPRPPGVSHGRAPLQPRRQAAHPDARRDHAHPAAAAHHDGLRHPRPDRGDDSRRPAGGDARRRHPAAGDARRALRAPAEPVRRRLHRSAGDELPHRRDRRGHGDLPARRDPARRPRRGIGPHPPRPSGRVVVGVRPESFEDAAMAGERPRPGGGHRDRGRAGVHRIRRLRPPLAQRRTAPSAADDAAAARAGAGDRLRGPGGSAGRRLGARRSRRRLTFADRRPGGAALSSTLAASICSIPSTGRRISG